jgi:hypothetical protein
MIMDNASKRISSLSCTTHVPQEPEQELILVSHCHFHFAYKKIYACQIKFDEGDPRDPQNFSHARKWAITLTCCVFAGITGNVGF